MITNMLVENKIEQYVQFYVFFLSFIKFKLKIKLRTCENIFLFIKIIIYLN